MQQQGSSEKVGCYKCYYDYEITVAPTENCVGEMRVCRQGSVDIDTKPSDPLSHHTSSGYCSRMPSNISVEKPSKPGSASGSGEPQLQADVKVRTIKVLFACMTLPLTGSG
jgi:hypothetical protein